SGSNSGHVALLGLMTYFDRPLGVTRSVYDWGAPYDDGFAVKVISSFTERVHQRSVVPFSAEYDRAMVEYLLLVGRHWPADLLTRAYASVLRVLELPFQIRLYTTSVPPGIAAGMAGRLYGLWVGVLSRLAGVGTAAAVVAIVAAAVSSVRVAIWLLLSLLYFAGYPAVQFDARHFFFLEVIPWLALVSVCAGALRVHGWSSAWLGVAGRRALALGVGLIIIVAAPVVLLRAYQQRHVTRLIESYLEAPTQTLTLIPAPLGNARCLLRPNELGQSTEPAVRAEYLMADITRQRCADAMVPVTVRYVTLPGYTDLSEQFDVSLPSSDSPFRLFFPVYYSPGGYFAGVEVPEADRGCVAGLRRVTSIDRTPILLNLTLPPDWRETKLYQTLTFGHLRIWSRG
ncbi:MAG TPA: hypothetical protein VGX46_17220, partial [Vicinamibacterales bacterium]|nr:hypothetical protein [Vicinamibacterales bacterium]